MGYFYPATERSLLHSEPPAVNRYSPYEPKTLSKLYFPTLDGLRFIAFLLVFLRHGTNPESNIGKFFHEMSWIGVDLFFVLTGFLFYVMLHAEFKKTRSICLKCFYLRRILRIMPLYFLYIIAAALVAASNGEPDVLLRFTALATFTSNLLYGFLGGLWSLPKSQHIWSIGFEEQVYLVLPWIILAILWSSKRWAVIVLILVAGVGTSLHAAAIDNKWVATVFGVYSIPVFRPETTIAGIVCGIAWTTGSYRQIPSSVYGLIFCLVLACIFLWSQVYGYEDLHYGRGIFIYWILFLLFSALVLYSLSDGSLAQKLFSLPPFPWLGKISYGLYVWHLFGSYVSWYYFIVPMQLPRTDEMRFITALVTTVAIATISYYAYERYFIRLKSRFQIVNNRDH